MSTLTDLRRERERYWSQSRLSAFLLCSLKYAFSYVYRIEPEHTSAALPFGTAVHRALEMLHLYKKEGQPFGKGEVCDLFSEIWTRELAETPDVLFKEGQDAESCRTQGMDLVSIFESNMSEDETVIAVSEAYAVPLMAADGTILEDPLIGEADLVVERSGKTVVVDWKTAARKWGATQAETQLQPTAMLYAYKQTHGMLPDFEYRIAVKTKTPGYQVALTSRSQDDFERMAEITRSVDRAIKAEAFMPNDGCFACGDCQFAGACKRWVQDSQAVSLRMAA